MIFSLVERGRLAARWSFVLGYESSRDPIPERREFVARVAPSCESSIGPDEEIGRLPRHVADVHEIRGRDALHLACGTASDCDYSVTCDARLVRQGQTFTGAAGSSGGCCAMVAYPASTAAPGRGKICLSDAEKREGTGFLRSASELTYCSCTTYDEMSSGR